MFKKILVALDGTADSQAILDEAMQLAAVCGGQLYLVSVVYPLDSGYPDPIYLSVDGLNTVMTTAAYEGYAARWQTLQQERLDWLAGQSQVVEQQGIAVEYRELLGEPGSCICEQAQSWGVDLIMMGRRGRTGLSEMLLGSVSNYVMHHASCSVLTVQRMVEAEPLPLVAAT